MSLIQKSKKDFKSIYGLIFVFIAAIRLFFNAVIPLTDKTEARYGEIARLMAETGNWIVPQIDYSVPFWAKPPLSTWLTAGSIRLLGEHEFALRLPFWIIGIIISLLLIPYGHKKKINGLIPGIILLTLPEFFLHTGVLSTDLMLSFSVFLTMIGFWEFLHSKRTKIFGLLFFVGIGLGLLSKGPIVGILSFPPLIIWCVLNRISLNRVLQIPWLLGGLISLMISFPWYYLMEINSPGFTDYFVVGEHFLRFIDPSWSGDKYGFPKQQPFGVIWVFLLIGALPWSFVLLSRLKKMWKDPWQLFLWLWILWTPFFFTFSKSLIHTYTLPVMIPIALLVTNYWPSINSRNSILCFAVSIPILMIGAFFLKPVQNKLHNSSDKMLVLNPVVDTSELYSFPFKSYSSQFYSKGKIKIINSDRLKKMVEDSTSFSVIIKKRQLEDLSSELMGKLKLIIERRKDGLYQLK